HRAVPRGSLRAQARAGLRAADEDLDSPPDPHGSVIVALVPAVQAAGVHPRAAVRRAHEPAVAEEDADVAKVVEEHQVARTQVVPLDVTSRVPLAVGDAWQRDSQLAVDVLDEARAVESLP